MLHSMAGRVEGGEGDWEAELAAKYVAAPRATAGRWGAKVGAAVAVDESDDEVMSVGESDSDGGE